MNGFKALPQRLSPRLLPATACLLALFALPAVSAPDLSGSAARGLSAGPLCETERAGVPCPGLVQDMGVVNPANDSVEDLAVLGYLEMHGSAAARQVRATLMPRTTPSRVTN